MDGRFLKIPLSPIGTHQWQGIIGPHRPLFPLNWLDTIIQNISCFSLIFDLKSPFRYTPHQHLYVLKRVIKFHLQSLEYGWQLTSSVPRSSETSCTSSTIMCKAEMWHCIGLLVILSRHSLRALVNRDRCWLSKPSPSFSSDSIWTRTRLLGWFETSLHQFSHQLIINRTIFSLNKLDSITIHLNFADYTQYIIFFFQRLTEVAFWIKTF